MSKQMNLNNKEIEILIELFDIVKEETGGLSDKQISLLKKITRKQKRISCSSAKAKGRNLQYFICAEIADMFDSVFDQSDDSCDIHSREMGQHGVDVILRGEILKKFPFAIECKNTEQLNLMGTIKQAEANLNYTTHPGGYLIVHKRNHITPVVIMNWFDFKKLFTKKA